MGAYLTEEELDALSEERRKLYSEATPRMKAQYAEVWKKEGTAEFQEWEEKNSERLTAQKQRDLEMEKILLNKLEELITDTGYGEDFSKALEEKCGMDLAPTGITATDEWWAENGCTLWGLVEKVAKTPGDNMLEQFNKCVVDNLSASGGKEYSIADDLYSEAATNQTITNLVQLADRGEFHRPDYEWSHDYCNPDALSIANKLQEIKDLWDKLQEVNERAEGEWSAAFDDNLAEKLCEEAEKYGGDCSNVDALAGAKALVMARNTDHGARGVKLEDVITPGYKKMAFKEQCFLLAKIFELAEQKINVVEKTAPETKKLPYYKAENPDDNASLMMTGDPYGFMNRLTQHPAQAAFFDMKTQEISSLQPMIRLFKVIDESPVIFSQQSARGEEREREFLFDAYASRGDVESLLTDNAKRGFGVGIKNFSFTYDGSNPFSAKKSIKAKLQIFANSFDELLKDRTNAPESPLNYKYADLALKTWTAKTETAVPGEKEPPPASSAKCEKIEAIREENKNKLTFRLKAVIGWARPSGHEGIFTTMTEDQQLNVLNAINESYVTLNLTPTNHEFDIDEMGRVNFTINYLAYAEDFFDQSQFDIFYDKEVAQNEIAREYIMYALNKKECSSANRDKFKKWMADNEIVARDKFKNTQSLITRLMGISTEIEQGDCTGTRSKIKYIELTHDELKGFLTKGPFYELGKKVKVVDNPSNSFAVSEEIAKAYKRSNKANTGNTLDDAIRKANLKFALEVSNPEKETISFFYVSDLLDVILKGIGDRLETYSQQKNWLDSYFNALEISEAAGMNEGLFDLDQFQIYMRRNITKLLSFKRQFKKFRLLMGPLEILNPKDDTTKIELGEPPSRWVNFGDVPISVKYFMEWMSAQTTAKEQSRYNLSKFLNDFFNNLLKNFLNNDTCFSFNTKQKTRLNQAAVTSYKEGGKPYDEVTQWIIKNSLKTSRRANLKLMSQRKFGAPPTRRSILNVSGPQGLPIGENGVGNEINWLVYFAGRTQPVELMNGSRSQDAQNGIFHYLIGRPRGIVKTINLSKTDAKFLKEVRFEQEGYNGLEQLREVYDVNIDCYANVKTFPGTYIYVDPRGFAPNTTSYAGGVMDLTRYGIGGYCMIIRSEHEFGPGQANTKLTAKWVSQLEHADDVAQCKTKITTAGDGSEKKPCDA